MHKHVDMYMILGWIGMEESSNVGTCLQRRTRAEFCVSRHSVMVAFYGRLLPWTLKSVIAVVDCTSGQCLQGFQWISF